MTSKIKTIEVKVLDSSKADEIKQALIDSMPQEDGKKFIILNFQSTTGDISVSVGLIDAIYKSQTECIAKCKGEIDLAGTIALASCKYGERKASAMAMFRFVEDDKNMGKKRTALNPNEKNALDILGVLSAGKKSRIKAFMLKGLKATANEARSLGLIDEVEKFTDKYAKERVESKKKATDDSEFKKEVK